MGVHSVESRALARLALRRHQRLVIVSLDALFGGVEMREGHDLGLQAFLVAIQAANLYPRAEDGLRSMAAVFAVAESGKAEGAWVDARPPMFRD